MKQQRSMIASLIALAQTRIPDDMPAFCRAFAIKPGDKLYLPPSERVKIW
ncbi:hypothetical protein ACK34W_04945 [Aeromonas veronii]